MVQERGIDNEFIDDVALGFRLNGGGSKNDIESKSYYVAIINEYH